VSLKPITARAWGQRQTGEKILSTCTAVTAARCTFSPSLIANDAPLAARTARTSRSVAVRANAAILVGRLESRSGHRHG
jgi:hypothetical protein